MLLLFKVVFSGFDIALLTPQQGMSNAICGLCHRLHNLDKYMFIIMLK
ncbi:hypothetical protein VCHA38O209_340002 [Vibrio chagasii]|nr:hypothetical protein VCHA34P117_10338 [Vibrio chagasii]CAH6908463.1 hypothetical protein VCHA34P120_20349 [Vibrio chagasii]CAH6991552.1 hypothetical protein VCHA34P112_40135 [Vibrio chagasii]CAH7006591.1 hypothetical protein VCHA48P439_10043 [Vibrio chagasii]CAH7048719.1 hypothetical protein VCHA40O236_10338 [Vibrio chagasii]